jgi:xylan 1,4-beta-xylosidase
LPSGVHRVLLRHYRIDESHSNAYTLWKSMGSPQNPSPGQYAAIERAGQLQLLDSPRWVTAREGEVKLGFALPREAVLLIEIQW